MLVLVKEYDNNFDIKAWKSVVVDGEVIKPDVWYGLKDGEIIELEE